MENARLIIVDPCHFHAALVQKDMYSWLAPQASVYAPLAPELLDYLNRVGLFNVRKENPTRWELDIHTGPDFFERMLRDKPGNVVIFAGRNRVKIDRILRSLEAGLHVLADKPWIIRTADLPKLERALELAEQKNLAAYDIMTERFEITSILQKELVNTPGVYGTHAKAGVKARSIHNVMKTVAGVPIRRPPQFFDVLESGEALSDVGTHVVDLIQWTVFPGQSLDYRKSVKIEEARRWPTVLNKAQFRQVTGLGEFPPSLGPWVKNDALEYFGNNHVRYSVEGLNIDIEIRWDWEGVGGTGDLYEASFQGTKSRIELRQASEDKHRPEVYVVPETREARPAVFEALDKKVAELQTAWPGIAVERRGSDAHIVIPEKFRVGHEAHFAQVTNAFASYFADPKKIPAWEKPNMLLKYFVTTAGVDQAQGRG